jgi:hypothetical protein
MTNHNVHPVRAAGILTRAGWDLNAVLTAHLAQAATEIEEVDDEAELEEDVVEEEGGDTNLGEPDIDELPVDENGKHQIAPPDSTPGKDRVMISLNYPLHIS